jgi:hypothetical protein
VSGLVLTQEQGRARINISANSGQYVTVTRTHPSGRTENVRGMVLTPLSGGQVVGWDWELPIGVSVTYTAYSYDDAAGSSVVATSNSVTVTWTTDNDWLKDPLEPARNLPVRVASMASTRYASSTTIHQVLNRPDPVTVGSVRQTGDGQLVLYTDTLDESDRLDYITASGHVLLFQSTQQSRVGNMYFAVTDVEEDRVEGALRDQPYRMWSLTYQRVGVPAGDPGAPVSLQDVADNPPGGSLQDLADAWTSLIALYEGYAETTQGDIVVWRGQ